MDAQLNVRHESHCGLFLFAFVVAQIFVAFFCTFVLSHEFAPHWELPMCGFIAQLVERRTGIRGGQGFESC